MVKTKSYYYFAYGSNMNFAQMIRRCPHAKFIGKAKLNNYQLAFSGRSLRWRGGGATILQKSGCEVWGGVFRIDQDCLHSLNGFEGIGYRKYHLKTVTCVFGNGRKKRVITYIRNSKRVNQPSRRYRCVVAIGMKNCDLPQVYIDRVKANW